MLAASFAAAWAFSKQINATLFVLFTIHASCSQGRMAVLKHESSLDLF